MARSATVKSKSAKRSSASKAKRATKAAKDQPLKARQSLGWMIRDLSRAMARSIQQLVIRHGVPLGHWYLLRALWEQDRITVRELSTVIGIADSSALKALEEMERAGLVTRLDHADDRRKTVIALTKKGASLKADLLPYVTTIRTRATNGMTKAEVTLLEQFVARMLANLAEDD